jgi:hypothetical protein
LENCYWTSTGFWLKHRLDPLVFQTQSDYGPWEFTFNPLKGGV